MNKSTVALALAFTLGVAGSRAADDGIPDGREETGLFLSLSRSAQKEESLPSQRSLVTREDIQRSGARNLGEALDMVPGAVFNRTGTLGNQVTLRLRGVPASNQVQILVDDQPLGGVSHQYVDLSQIPVDNIERIEIIRGGSSVLYGANAIGGLVNVITRKPSETIPVTNIGASWSSFNTQVYHGDVGAATGWGDGLITFGRTMSDGFQQNSDVDSINVSGRGNIKIYGGGKVTLQLARTDSEVGLPNGTPIPLGEWNGKREQEAVDKTSRLKTKTAQGRVKVVSPPLAGWVSETSIYHGQLSYNNFDTGYPSNRQEKTLGGDLRFMSPFGTNLGGSYERDERRAEGESHTHIFNLAGYVQQTWRLGPVHLDAALRADHHSAFGNTYNPRYGIVYRITEAMKWSASAARSFRAPTFLDLYYPGYGNPQLRPETAWSYDCGLEWTGPEWGGIRSTVFYTKIRDRIALDDTFVPANQPQAESSGVEVEGRQKVGFLNFRTAYAFTRAIDTGFGTSTNRALRLTPRHTASEELVVDLPGKVSIRNFVRYSHKQFLADGDTGSKFPSFTLWNASITKKILSSEFVLGVDNVTDKHYTESKAYSGFVPQPGRTYRVGVNMRFEN